MPRQTRIETELKLINRQLALEGAKRIELERGQARIERMLFITMVLVLSLFALAVGVLARYLTGG